MSILTNKTQDIYNQLNYLLPQFKRICVTKFNHLPRKIDKMIVGEDKLSLCFNKTIQELTENDFGDATYVNEYAFSECSNLTNVIMPNNITAINSLSFSGCENLINVTLSNNLVSIGINAFHNCKNLKSITIPVSVTQIGIGTFNNCSSLVDIYLHPTTPPTLASRTLSSQTTIHVPVGSGNAYKSATNWSNYADNIVEDIVVE